LPRSVANFVAAVPTFVGQLLGMLRLQGGVWTAFRTSELLKLRHNTFKSFMQEVDVVVALTEWVRMLLLRNGVPRKKIIVSRHGVPHTKGINVELIDVNKTPLRVAFLGRARRDKGADTLLRAMRNEPELHIELHLYGITQSAADEEYWKTLRRLAADDSRVAFLPAVLNDEVISLLKNYHVLAVPSRWLETGPLVVLEALAAGTPVLASSLDGITEWIRHEHNGLLVEPEVIDAFRRCVSDRMLVSKLPRWQLKWPN